MSRKKSAEGNGTATLEAPETTTVPEAIPLDPSSETTPTSPTEGNGHTNGDKKKPLVSWRLNSDRSTSLECAVWANTYVNRETNADYEQLSVTVARSYKDQNGAWCKGGSYRVHDLTVLVHLLEKARAFAFDRRTSDSSMPF